MYAGSKQEYQSLGSEVLEYYSLCLKYIAQDLPFITPCIFKILFKWAQRPMKKTACCNPFLAQDSARTIAAKTTLQSSIYRYLKAATLLFRAINSQLMSVVPSSLQNDRRCDHHAPVRRLSLSSCRRTSLAPSLFPACNNQPANHGVRI